jgi:hypothetical protein
MIDSILLYSEITYVKEFLSQIRMKHRYNTINIRKNKWHYCLINNNTQLFHARNYNPIPMKEVNI